MNLNERIVWKMNTSQVSKIYIVGRGGLSLSKIQLTNLLDHYLSGAQSFFLESRVVRPQLVHDLRVLQ